MTNKENKNKGWESNWKNGEDEGISTYKAAGKVEQLTPSTVNALRNTCKWGNNGIGYIRNKSDEVVAVIFISNDEGDIYDAIKHNLWQHSKNAKQAFYGADVFILPNRKVLNKNPNAIGATFKLSDFTYSN